MGQQPSRRGEREARVVGRGVHVPRGVEAILGPGEVGPGGVVRIPLEEPRDGLERRPDEGFGQVRVPVVAGRVGIVRCGGVVVPAGLVHVRRVRHEVPPLLALEEQQVPVALGVRHVQALGQERVAAVAGIDRARGLLRPVQVPVELGVDLVGLHLVAKLAEAVAAHVARIDVEVRRRGDRRERGEPVRERVRAQRAELDAVDVRVQEVVVARLQHVHVQHVVQPGTVDVRRLVAEGVDRLVAATRQLQPDREAFHVRVGHRHVARAVVRVRAETFGAFQVADQCQALEPDRVGVVEACAHAHTPGGEPVDERVGVRSVLADHQPDVRPVRDVVAERVDGQLVGRRRRTEACLVRCGNVAWRHARRLRAVEQQRVQRVGLASRAGGDVVAHVDVDALQPEAVAAEAEVVDVLSRLEAQVDAVLALVGGVPDREVRRERAELVAALGHEARAVAVVGDVPSKVDAAAVVHQTPARAVVGDGTRHERGRSGEVGAVEVQRVARARVQPGVHERTARIEAHVVQRAVLVRATEGAEARVADGHAARAHEHHMAARVEEIDLVVASERRIGVPVPAHRRRATGLGGLDDDVPREVADVHGERRAVARVSGARVIRRERRVERHRPAVDGGDAARLVA